jgi:hypothetical protein
MLYDNKKLYDAQQQRSKAQSGRTDTHKIRRKLFYFPSKNSPWTATHFLHLSDTCTKQPQKASKGTALNLVVTFEIFFSEVVSHFMEQKKAGCCKIRQMRQMADLQHIAICQEVLHYHVK